MTVTPTVGMQTSLLTTHDFYPTRPITILECFHFSLKVGNALKGIFTELAVIKGSYPIVVEAIKALKGRLSLVEAMEIVEKLQRELVL